MAETYGIYDLRALPIDIVAVLACGLRANARINQKKAGLEYMPPEHVLIRIHDMLVSAIMGKKAKRDQFLHNILKIKNPAGKRRAKRKVTYTR